MSAKPEIGTVCRILLLNGVTSPELYEVVEQPSRTGKVKLAVATSIVRDANNVITTANYLTNVSVHRLLPPHAIHRAIAIPSATRAPSPPPGCSGSQADSVSTHSTVDIGTSTHMLGSGGACGTSTGLSGWVACCPECAIPIDVTAGDYTVTCPTHGAFQLLWTGAKSMGSKHTPAGQRDSVGTHVPAGPSGPRPAHTGTVTASDTSTGNVASDIGTGATTTGGGAAATPVVVSAGDSPTDTNTSIDTGNHQSLSSLGAPGGDVSIASGLHPGASTPQTSNMCNLVASGTTSTASQVEHPGCSHPGASLREVGSTSGDNSVVDIAAVGLIGELWIKRNVKFDHPTVDVKAYTLLVACTGTDTGVIIRKHCFNTYDGRLGRKAKPMDPELFKHPGSGFRVQDIDKARSKLVSDGYVRLSELPGG